MPVRRILKSLVLKSVEPTVREWVDAVRRDTDDLRNEVRRAAEAETEAPAGPSSAEQALTARLSTVEDESAQLKKKLSMAMGAIQAASAQIVQLRQEAEQAANIARQAMQRATSAQAAAEAANEGLNELEAPTEVEAPRADGKAEAPRCKIEGCTSRARTRGMCSKHAKQAANGLLGPA